jgi:hypothetical protein
MKTFFVHDSAEIEINEAVIHSNESGLFWEKKLAVTDKAGKVKK